MLQISLLSVKCDFFALSFVIFIIGGGWGKFSEGGKPVPFSVMRAHWGDLVTNIFASLESAGITGVHHAQLPAGLLLTVLIARLLRNVVIWFTKSNCPFRS